MGVAWAHGNAPTAVAWALTAAVAASWIGAIIWCSMPLLRLQRDPLLRRMGLTPWRSRAARQHQWQTRMVLLAILLGSGVSYGLSGTFFPEWAGLLSPLNFPLVVVWLLIVAVMLYRAVISDGAVGE